MALPSTTTLSLKRSDPLLASPAMAPEEKRSAAPKRRPVAFIIRIHDSLGLPWEQHEGHRTRARGAVFFFHSFGYWIRRMGRACALRRERGKSGSRRTKVFMLPRAPSCIRKQPRSIRTRLRKNGKAFLAPRQEVCRGCRRAGAF